MDPKASTPSAAVTITVEEAARRLGINRNSAYEGVKRGEIPVVRIGRRLLVPLAPFERMLGLTSASSAEVA